MHSCCLALMKAKDKIHGLFPWGCKTQTALEGFKANKCYRLGLKGPARTVVEGVVHNRGCSGSWWILYFYSCFILFLNSLWVGRRRKGKRGERQRKWDSLESDICSKIITPVPYFLNFLWNVTHQCWRDGSVAQSTYCSPRGLESVPSTYVRHLPTVSQ